MTSRKLGAIASIVVVGLAFSAMPSLAHVIAPLFPLAEVTHTAVADGNYSDPATWGGVVPGSIAKVLIPAGRVVTINDEVPQATWIFVQSGGVLRFANTANTQIDIETIGCDHGGKLEIGTAANPIPANLTAKVRIIARNGGVIDHVYDPLELSRGVICEGAIEMHGAIKTPFVHVDAPITLNAPAGSYVVTTRTAPSGWAAGDTVVLTSSEFDKELTTTIADVTANAVTLAVPIVFQSAIPANCPSSRCSLQLANLTRNVSIETHPSGVADLTKQGHTMFMGGDVRKFRYVQFKDLGRTHVRKPVTDPFVDAQGGRDANLFPLCGAGVENVRGRYPLHIHNPSNGANTGPLTPQAVIEGVVVRNPYRSNIKNGIVNHESNVSVRDSVVHNIDGSPFFSEEGNEVGEVRDSLFIHADGWEIGGIDHDLNFQCMTQNYPVQWQARRMGVGFQGHVWIHGGGIDVLNNIAAGLESYGFDIWPRPLDYSNKTGTFHVKFPRSLLRDLGIPWLAPEHDSIEVDDIPIKVNGNQAYATNTGERYAGRGGFELKFASMHADETYPGIPYGEFYDNTSWNNFACVVTAYAGGAHIKNTLCVMGTGTNPRSGPGHAMLLGVQGGRHYNVQDNNVWGFLSPGMTALDSVYSGNMWNGQPFTP